MYRRFMERLYLMTNLCWVSLRSTQPTGLTNLCWVSRGDVPWQVSTQPTGLTLICVLWLADITLPGGLD